MVNNERTAPPTDTPPGGEREGPHTPDCWRSHHACAVAKIEREQAHSGAPDVYLPVDSDGYVHWSCARATEHDALLALSRLPGYDGFSVVLRPLYTHPAAPREVSAAMVEAAAMQSARDWDALDESLPERDEHHENHVEAMESWLNARLAHHLTAALRAGAPDA